MNYPTYFLLLIFICTFLGFLVSLYSNDIYDDLTEKNMHNNYMNYSYTEEELQNLIKEKEKELRNSDQERQKILEAEIIRLKNELKLEKDSKKENIKISTKNGKPLLACSYALDNGFVYPTLVAITSLVENAGNKIFYNIYLLCSPDFKQKNKNILLTIKNKYPDRCDIIFINMGDKFKGSDSDERIPIASYYRLDLPDLLPDVDRIIYMDGDTLVLHELSELITIDMKGNFVLGFPDSAPGALLKFGIKSSVYICAGVILMDLEAMRKDHTTKKFKGFIEANLGNIEQHDQTTINYMLHGKISALPPEYGMWNFRNAEETLYHNRIQPHSIKYDEEKLLTAYFHPYILHYVRCKPFQKVKPQQYYMVNEWWKYAEKCDYYDEINKMYVRP